jgi:hypothetical protein
MMRLGNISIATVAGAANVVAASATAYTVKVGDVVSFVDTTPLDGLNLANKVTIISQMLTWSARRPSRSLVMSSPLT